MKNKQIVRQNRNNKKHQSLKRQKNKTIAYNNNNNKNQKKEKEKYLII